MTSNIRNLDHTTEMDLTANIPPIFLKAALYVEKILLQKGFEVYLVGGSVRDLLLNKKISDLDFTTNAHPDEVKKVFPRTIPVGEQFGTILVMFHHIPIELTTYRSEGVYKDGRRPESVTFGKSLYEDVIRRDFTINGLAYQISSKLLIDYVGGRKDLKAGIIRTIGDPEERFQEDGLRPIRGCRIMANLGFNLEIDTEKAMSKTLDIISKIAPERFYDEWRKTLKIRQKHQYWNILKKTGIFQLFFGEFQGLLNNETRWNNLLFCIEHSMPRNMAIYTAHFFYQEMCQEDRYEILDKEALRSVLKDFYKRNRFPAKIQKQCTGLLTSPILGVLDASQGSALNILSLKKALSKIAFNDWFLHLRFIKEILYRHYINKPDELVNIMNQIIHTIRKYRKKQFALYLSELKIDGDDISRMGVHGVKIGQLLQQSLDFVIQYPDKNNPADLKNFMRHHLE
ncbi:MAG: hypothetical protein OEV66_00015 [Spirochaetia bacterium]|nr:hypothetical protein [Spirochaetia bacterium]